MSLGNPCRHCVHEEELHMPDPRNWAEDLCTADIDGRFSCECVRFQPVEDPRHE